MDLTSGGLSVDCFCVPAFITSGQTLPSAGDHNAGEGSGLVHETRGGGVGWDILSTKIIDFHDIS